MAEAETGAGSASERPETTGAPAGDGDPAVAIALDGLGREFDDRPVLAGVALTVAVGATLAVLGPNGAGKTTLLRVLAGLLRPSSGRVSVLGCELPRDRRGLAGRIGWLGHSPLLYDDLSALENLRFGARIHNLGEAGERRAHELLQATGISRFSGQLVRTLSAGTVQRLAVCSALIHDPELLLLDEPTSHLDPSARAAIEPLIGAAAGRTRVVVSHEPERAAAEADLVLALGRGGRPAYSGPAAGFSGELVARLYAGGAAG